jgi:hypothetical protein
MERKTLKMRPALTFSDHGKLINGFSSVKKLAFQFRQFEAGSLKVLILIWDATTDETEP